MSLATAPTPIPTQQALHAPVHPSDLRRWLRVGLWGPEAPPPPPPPPAQVPIVRAMPEKKPFLGGFRSRKTAVEYHHASSQTDPKVRSEDEPLPPPKYHRETQTAVQQTRSQITVREAGTQMEVHGHVVVEELDVLVAPLPYFDSEQLAELRLHKAIDAQRYTRGWFARCQAAALRRRQAEEAEAVHQAELQQQAEVQERHKKEIQRRMHPQNHGDFEVLYNELEAWRVQETARINEAAADPESPTSEQARLACLAQLPRPRPSATLFTPAYSRVRPARNRLRPTCDRACPGASRAAGAAAAEGAEAAADHRPAAPAGLGREPREAHPVDAAAHVVAQEVADVRRRGGAGAHAFHHAR